jgi:phosphatidylinositol glycan class B
LVKGYEQFLTFFPKPFPYRRPAWILGGCLGLLNVAALVPAVFAPPAGGRISVTRYVAEHYNGSPAKVYALRAEEENPFQPYSFLRQSYYELPNVRFSQFSDYNELSEGMFGADTIGLLVIHQGELGNPAPYDKIKALHLQRVAVGVPPWILAIQGLYERNAWGEAYVLYEKAR